MRYYTFGRVQVVLVIALLLFISESSLAFQHRLSPNRKFTAFSTRGRNFENNKVDNKGFQSLITDVAKVITTTGPRQGIKRSIQVARAVNKVTISFVRDQSSFKDSNGNLSIPKTIKRLFEELGATYIKLGQFIASSPTLFPAEFVLEFQSCLDNTPKVSYESIKKIIQDDLKRPLSAVYSYVDPIPLASASVAQVHRAKLLDGTEVVIKVRKPGATYDNYS
jgi:predicted unusual protein kinase regulating ubiquinone biosynthesis (AarF/ABC1/UbiB family)